MFKIDGFEVEFEPEAISFIAKQAIELKTGARGIRTIMENKMLELMFDLPDSKMFNRIIITKDFFEKGAKPILEKKEENQAEEAV